MKLELDKAIVVDANNTDKFLLWQYFAKIEQPVVIARSEKARLILRYIKGKLYFNDISND